MATPNLSLPEIAASQAQKHVTHNEALFALDALVQLSAKSRTLTVPPTSPSDGDRWIVPASATGEWAGKTGQIASRLDGAWTFYQPKAGWTCFVEGEGLVSYVAGIWVGYGAVVNAYRHPNHFVIFGDSRMADVYVDSAKRITNGRHFINVANARLGKRIRIVGHYALSGYRADQYLTEANLAQAISTDAKYAVIFGIVNDAAQNFPAGDPFNVSVKPFCEKLIAAGITPILITDPGANNLNANTVARAGVQRYNNLIKNYAAFARPNGQVLCFDLATLVLDLTTTTVALKTAYTSDGTHYTVPMGLACGRAFAQFIQTFVPPLAVRKVFGGETPALGIQNFANPAFLTTTGGILGSFTGTAPAGVTGTALDSGISAVIGTATNADGSKDMTVDVTASNAGRARVTMDMSPSTYGNAGAYYDISAQCDIAAGGSGLASAYLFAQVNRDGASQDWADMYGDASSTPGVGLGGIAETLDFNIPVLIQAGTPGYFTVRFIMYFGSAGSASFKWRNLAVDARQS